MNENEYLDNTYWDRLNGYVTELRVDARWTLRKHDDDKPYGSLRIVSHPDLKPGYLRAYFTYVISAIKKTKTEILQTLEDYQVEEIELEAFSIDNKIETESIIHEAPFKELEKIFNVKVFK